MWNINSCMNAKSNSILLSIKVRTISYKVKAPRNAKTIALEPNSLKRSAWINLR